MNKVVVSSVMEKLHKQFSQIASSKGLELIIDQPDSDIDRHFYTDNPKLIQVLSNLLANACKFTQEGHIIMSFAFQKDYIEFCDDTGIGIPEDNQRSLRGLSGR
jgi:signal transduction histidine kinase